MERLRQFKKFRAEGIFSNIWSEMHLQLDSGEKAPDLTNEYAQGSVLSVHFGESFFENHSGITLTFYNEDIMSASDDGSFTLSGVGWTIVTAKLNDFVYDKTEVTSLTDCQMLFKPCICRSC